MSGLLSLAALLLVTGCASAPMYTTNKSPETGYALVYIYWLHEATITSFTPGIIINNTPYQRIGNGRYIYSYLREGRYALGLQYGLKRLSGEFKFNSGGTYFIKVSAGIRPVGLSYTLMNFTMKVVDSKTGRQEIKNTTLMGELEL